MEKRFALIIACILLFTFTSIKGQDTLKAFSNRWGTELNFNPFNGSLTMNNSNAQIKLRKFYNNNKALRIALTVGYMQDNSKAESPYGSYPIDDNLRRSSMYSAINIGVENHFSGSRRISPYIGWEVGIGYKTSKQVEKNNSTETSVKGAWVVVDYYYNGGYYFTHTSISERGFWSLGANLVAGFDFYMTKGFYFGYEVLFGLDYTNFSNISFSPKVDPYGDTHPTLKDESWRLGPKIVNGVRIGFLF